MFSNLPCKRFTLRESQKLPKHDVFLNRNRCSTQSELFRLLTKEDHEIRQDTDLSFSLSFEKLMYLREVTTIIFLLLCRGVNENSSTYERPYQLKFIFQIVLIFYT